MEGAEPQAESTGTRISRMASLVLAVCFPFYLWFVSDGFSSLTAGYLILIGVFRWAATRGEKNSPHRFDIGSIFILGPILLGVAVFWAGPDLGLYYPTLVNVGLLLYFLSTLSGPRSAIQQIAEKMERRTLDATGILYTRRVTMLWCLMFGFNAVVALLLALSQNLDAWTLYNGVVAYILIGVLLLGERMLRPWIRKRMMVGEINHE